MIAWMGKIDKFKKVCGYCLSAAVIFICAACFSKQEARERENEYKNILVLLEQVRSTEIPLSECLAQALPIAEKHNDKELARFCQDELFGYKKVSVKNKRARYRFLEVFCPLKKDLSGLTEEAPELFMFIDCYPELFQKTELFILQPITVLEKIHPADPDKSFLKLMCQANENSSGAGFCYARGNSYLKVVEAVRMELIRKLTGLFNSSIF